MRKIIVLLTRLIFLDYFSFRKRGEITVFMFHKLNEEKTRFYQGMPYDTFDKLCRYIKKHYEVVSLEFIQQNKLSPRKKYAVITFDDGHKEIKDIAYPILQKIKLTFNINIDTEIITTGEPQDFVKIYDILNSLNSIDKITLPSFGEFNLRGLSNIQIESFFTDKLSELTRDERTRFINELIEETDFNRAHFSKMLTKEDIAFLHLEGVEIGSHSHTHSILPNLSNDKIEFELSNSKNILEEITGNKISILAFPNGKTNETIERIAKEKGYSIVLETEDKVNKLSVVISGTTVKLKRINQYHQTLNEALFHTYGIKNKIKFWKD